MDLLHFLITFKINEVFLNQQYYIDASWNMGKNWTLNSDVNYTRYSNESFGSNNSRLWIWNASLARNFMDNRAQLSLNAVDILNQNVGINRSSELNYIRESRVASLARYVMLRFTFSISGLRAEETGGFQITRRSN